ncbi:MAG: hydroxyquinol 1,2-dioxygenase [Actinomycetota bacterium]|nr:hydroxyquinol 1,2-dioxygenase [Actinomycetota bacterium]
MTTYATRFGSLDSYEKGTLEIIDDDPKHYTYSNMFEVASTSKPYEKVAVAKNMEYVLEVIRAEGTSEWRTCAHDEFALVMDGEVEIRLVKLDEPRVPPEKEGSVALDGEPVGQKMGSIRARRGHMALLPANSAYRFHCDGVGVVLMQTVEGEDTVFKWAEICITSP